MTTLYWRDASAALEALADGDRHLLALLARLPLLPVAALARLHGLRGGAAIYRRLQGLRAGGLVAAATPALAAGRSPALWHPTDLGLAVVALADGVAPRALAQRHGLREGDLRALADRLPELLALYALVAALAAARPGRPELVAWARPWRATFPRPRAKRDGHIRLPAGIALRWGDESSAFLLLPDIGTAPVRAFRRVAGQLLACRADLGGALPTLLVATAGRRRADAWADVLAEAAKARREDGLDARIVTWERIRADPAALLRGLEPRAKTLPRGGRAALPALPHPPSEKSLPRLVGAGLPAGDLAPAEWALLDLIGRHPFLPSDRLHTALDAPAAGTRRRRNRLRDLGLARLVGRDEVADEYARRELAELTATGLARLAARHGLGLAEAVRRNGLAGGGPASPLGNRRQLLATLEHTLGADAVFLDLHRSCHRSGAALVEWRGAAAVRQGAYPPRRLWVAAARRTALRLLPGVRPRHDAGARLRPQVRRVSPVPRAGAVREGLRRLPYDPDGDGAGSRGADRRGGAEGGDRAWRASADPAGDARTFGPRSARDARAGLAHADGQRAGALALIIARSHE